MLQDEIEYKMQKLNDRKKKEKSEHEKTSVFGNILFKIIFLFIHFFAAFARARTHAHARIILFNIKF